MDTSKVVIDDPQTRCLTKPSGAINGWFAIHNYEIPEEFQFRVGPIVLPHAVLKREDVEAALPEYSVVGFQIRFDLNHYLLYIDDNRLTIRLIVPDHYPFAVRFTIKEGVLASCIAAASGV
jgi:hypothetical protein